MSEDREEDYDLPVVQEWKLPGAVVMADHQPQVADRQGTAKEKTRMEH